MSNTQPGGPVSVFMAPSGRVNVNILITRVWNGQYSVQCSRFWHSGTPEDGRLVQKHVMLIAKANVNGEINSCIHSFMELSPS
jgi:hypothetical protein